MTRTRIAISREIRESILVLTSPIIYILILLELIKTVSDFSLFVFFIIYFNTITFLFIFIYRGLKQASSLSADPWSDAIPPKFDNQDQSYKERINDVTEHLLRVETDHQPIDLYEIKDPLPNVVYAVAYFIVSLVVYSFLILLFAVLGQLGFLKNMIDLIIQAPSLISSAEILISDFTSLQLLIQLPPRPSSTRDAILLLLLLFPPGYVFSFSAYNLSLLSEKAHRMLLRKMTEFGYIFKYEFINSILILSIYLLYFSI